MKLNEIKLAETEKEDNVKTIKVFMLAAGYKYNIDYQIVNGCVDMLLNFSIPATAEFSKFKELPFKFGNCDGDFEVDGLRSLETLKGFPLSVKGRLRIAGLKNLKSFEGLTQKIGKSLFAETTYGITNLTGIADQLGSIGDTMFMSWSHVYRGGLGLLLVKDLQGLGESLPLKRPTAEPFFIIDKHLRGNRDVFECQQELIETGYEDYAVL